MAAKKIVKDFEDNLGNEDSSCDVYTPDLDYENLECNEDAYNLIEYLELDWPSQTVVNANNCIFVATNPADDKLEEASLAKINFKNGLDNPIFNTISTEGRIINRMRANDHFIYAISDDAILSYSFDPMIIESHESKYSYGLFVNNENIFVGKQDGSIDIFDIHLNLLNTFKIHEKSVESIVYKNNKIYSASADKTVKITSQNGLVLKIIENDAEVNALDVSGDQIVFGDDVGKITISDGNTSEIIKWHLSPIEMIKFLDENVFCTLSVEQVCIWDLTLDSPEEESKFSRYLLFVHQGQKFYKDIAFLDKKCAITTSENGLCIFEPVSLNEFDE